MNFIVIGAGAIGVYIGGSLMAAGNQVTFIDREEHIPLLKKNGITLNLKTRVETLLNISVLPDLEKAIAEHTYDAMLLAVKAFDTQGFADNLRSLSSHLNLPPLVCLQNGVENEDLLAGVLGAERVVAASVTSAIGRRGVGEVSLERLRGIGLAGTGSLVESLVRVFSEAGLRAVRYPDARAMKWSKMLTNLPANAMSAITGMKPVEIFTHPGLYRLETAQIHEATAVMEALGLEITDLPGTPVRAMAWCMNRLPTGISRPLIARILGKGRGEKMPSFFIDYVSGRGKSEVDYLNGAVVRAGEKAGVPTPVNRFLTGTLLGMVEGRIPAGRYDHQPERLLEDYFAGK